MGPLISLSVGAELSWALNTCNKTSHEWLWQLPDRACFRTLWMRLALRTLLFTPPLANAYSQIPLIHFVEIATVLICVVFA
jgi:hypothetical protein